MNDDDVILKAAELRRSGTLGDETAVIDSGRSSTSTRVDFKSAAREWGARGGSLGQRHRIHASQVPSPDRRYLRLAGIPPNDDPISLQ